MWRLSAGAREKIVGVFLLVFYVTVIPASALFSIVSSVIMSAFSLKGTLFLLTGSASLSGEPMPEALQVSISEFLISLAFIIVGIMVMITYYRLKKRRKNQRLFAASYPVTLPDSTDGIGGMERVGGMIGENSGGVSLNPHRQMSDKKDNVVESDDFL